MDEKGLFSIARDPLCADAKATSHEHREIRALMSRDHGVIKQWAARHKAEPATGEATASGPATVEVNDGGAGIRFNFPNLARFRPITWEEWFRQFDENGLVLIVQEETASGERSNFNKLVKRDETEPEGRGRAKGASHGRA